MRGNKLRFKIKGQDYFLEFRRTKRGAGTLSRLRRRGCRKFQSRWTPLPFKAYTMDEQAKEVVN